MLLFSFKTLRKQGPELWLQVREGVLARRAQIPGPSKGPFNPFPFPPPRKRRDGQRNNQIVVSLALTPEEILRRGLSR